MCIFIWYLLVYIFILGSISVRFFFDSSADDFSQPVHSTIDICDSGDILYPSPSRYLYVVLDAWKNSSTQRSRGPDDITAPVSLEICILHAIS